MVKSNRFPEKTLNRKVFFPPILILTAVVVYSLYDNDAFLAMATIAQNWILDVFGWLFTWSAFLFLILLGIVYFSPLAHQKIGGEEAEPILTKWKLSLIHI